MANVHRDKGVDIIKALRSVRCEDNARWFVTTNRHICHDSSRDVQHGHYPADTRCDVELYYKAAMLTQNIKYL